jgi:thiamine biosynthesis lipoprotein
VARTALAEGFAAADRVGAKLLADRPGSEIDILTKVPSHLWPEISPITYQALTLAARIAEETEGAYDPTWPALLRVWGLRSDGSPHVPRDFEIDMTLRRVDWSDVEIRDQDGLQARRLNRRTEIDLGGLARGAMLDAATTRLRTLGVAAARASTRDEHSCFGGTQAQPWQVVLSIDAPETTVALLEGAIARSTRGVAIETPSGETIHDHFDPRTGRPAQGSRWVAVGAASAAASAGYADAVLVMGRQGRSWAQTRTDLRAVIVPLQGEVWASPELAIQTAP